MSSLTDLIQGAIMARNDSNNAWAVDIKLTFKLEGLELIIAALGFDPEKVIAATEKLRASSAALAASVAANAGTSPPPPTP